MDVHLVIIPISVNWVSMLLLGRPQSVSRSRHRKCRKSVKRIGKTVKRWGLSSGAWVVSI